MALKVGELYTVLKMDSSKFNRGIKELESEMKELQGRANDLRIKLAGVAPDSVDASRFNGELREVQERMNTVQGASQAMREELAKSPPTLDKLGSTLTKSVTLPLIAAAGAAFQFAKAQAAWAEQLGNLSASTGLSAEALQKWKFVAENSGLSFDAFARSLTILQKRIRDSMKDGSAVSEVFKTLGISVKDAGGNIRGMNDLLPEIIERLRNVKNPVERNALAMELFGRAVQDITPFLRMSNEELEAYFKQAAESGNVLSNDTVRKLQDFNYKLYELTAKMKGFFLTLMEGFLALPDPAQKAVLALLGLAAVAGPLLKLVAVLEQVRNATILAGIAARVSAINFTALWAAITGPVAIVIAVIAAVAAAAWLIYKNWDRIKSFFADMWEAVKIGTRAFLQFLYDAFIRYNLLTVLKNNWSGIVDFVSNLWNAVYDITIGRFGRMFRWLTDKINAIAAAFRNLYDDVVGHSSVPDLIDGIEKQFGRLGGKAMAVPVQTATGRAAAQFAGMGSPLGGNAGGVHARQIEILLMAQLSELKRLNAPKVYS